MRGSLLDALPMDSWMRSRYWPPNSSGNRGSSPSPDLDSTGSACSHSQAPSEDPICQVLPGFARWHLMVNLWPAFLLLLGTSSVQAQDLLYSDRYDAPLHPLLTRP